MKKISLKKAISYGWSTTLDNFWPLAGILILVSLGASFSFLSDGNWWLSLLSFIIQIIVSLVLIRILLNVYDKKRFLAMVWENLLIIFGIFYLQKYCMDF